MPSEKKPVYNGYEEAFLTGLDLKEKYKNSFYTGGRHHEVVYDLSVPVMLELIGIQDNTTYRVFFNDFFCRIMKKDTDGLIKFFGHIDMPKVKESNQKYDLQQSVCPECGKPLKLKAGRFGEFIACSGYPSCKFTSNIKYLASIL